jgi:transcriptional regulatory protein RtcR
MILRAIEERRFLPVGADAETRSEFQLIAGTNRNVMTEVAAGFRDLAASVTRMATLCPTGRIDRAAVDFKTQRLARLWSGDTPEGFLRPGPDGDDRPV